MKKKIAILALINLILLIIGKFNFDAIKGLIFMDVWIISALYLNNIFYGD